MNEFNEKKYSGLLVPICIPIELLERFAMVIYNGLSICDSTDEKVKLLKSWFENNKHLINWSSLTAMSGDISTFNIVDSK